MYCDKKTTEQPLFNLLCRHAIKGMYSNNHFLVRGAPECLLGVIKSIPADFLAQIKHPNVELTESCFDMSVDRDFCKDLCPLRRQALLIAGSDSIIWSHR
jgi:hypothetical protein